MTSQQSSSATGRQSLSALIHKIARRSCASSHDDFVFGTLCWIGGVVTATDSGGDEEIVVPGIIEHVGAFFGMGTGGVVGEVVGSGAAGFGGGGCHGYLVDVVPEGTEVETVGRGGRS